MTDKNTQTYQNWQLEKDAANIAWLCFDKAESSANVLSSDVLLEFDAIIADFAKDLPRGVVIHSGKRNGFIMGADITEFSSLDSQERAYEVVRLGQGVFDRLESLACPTIAMLSGFTLGGGLELAMACDYRLALPNKKPVIGLPEVQLGLHPGFGGTVRAVQIMGVRNAMQLMLTGKPITVEKARDQGLVDDIVAQEKSQSSWQSE